ncbi:hypothetical protein C9426_27295 [Serratia sp. S1B]|nr:hypothetical protein C9426_27295 [Serratia sp. S1B]
MIYLIVGQPRSGKTQYAVKVAFDIHEQNEKIQQKIDSGKELKSEDKIRPIYTDIDGLDIFNKAPADWREVPDDAVIFYDEVHYREEFLDQSKYMTKNQMIMDLSVHGHRNIDIYLITQDPRRLEKSIRALIFKMYLVKRPANLPPFANIYTFDRWLGDPWSASKNKDNVHDEQFFYYKKKYQDAYKSASAHTSMQFKIQRKFIVAIVAIICMIALSVFLFKKSGTGKMVTDAMNVSKQHEMTNVDKNKIMAASGTSKTVTTIKDLNLECRKAENVDKPDCKAWFDQLSKTGQSVQAMTNPVSSASGSPVAQQVSYNPADPYNDKDIKSKIQYQAVNQPKFSGCMKTSSGYRAYTEQGTYLKASKAVCDRLMQNSGDRPYDYFTAKNQAPLSDSSSKNIANTDKKSDADQTAAFVVPNTATFPEKDITKPTI